MFSTFAPSVKVFTCLLNSQSWLMANMQKFGAALLAVRQLLPQLLHLQVQTHGDADSRPAAPSAALLIGRHSCNISAFPRCSNTTGWVEKHANNILITGHREYTLV